jgi:RNA-directed DNA polymerase
MVAHSMATPPTRRGGPTATTGVEWIAQQACRAPQTRYTALMHHFTVNNLRACFTALDGTKAPGVDGVTKAMYAQDMEENLQALHRHLHQMSYRPQPVRRVEPYSDTCRTCSSITKVYGCAKHYSPLSLTPGKP